jgi:xanthine dehydrogenase/oxidase
MSLYALVRNSYDPVTKCFHLSENDIELEGHLDGNLCRCTGYKPILKAAKTFITEDLKGQLANDSSADSDPSSEISGEKGIPYQSETASRAKRVSKFSCGRPGGCCRDAKMPAVGLESSSSPKSPAQSSASDDAIDSLESDLTSSVSSVGSPESDPKVPTVGASYGKPMKSREKAKEVAPIEGVETTTTLDTPITSKKHNMPQYDFKPYSPMSELVFPPSLRKGNKATICYGNSTRMWLRPVSLQLLLDMKNAYPSAKLVGGSSEVQVEIRFKNTPFAVSIYVSEVEELKEIEIPEDELTLASMTELVIGANASLTDVESTCKMLYAKIGQRAQVLEAIRKQLRYFAGRQIRNVASLAGNIATASPISDMNPVLLAVNAILGVQSIAKGHLRLPLSSFFIAYRTTALPADAVITSVHIPLTKPGASEITKAYKQAKRKDDDIAIVTAAFRVRLDGNGCVEDVTLAYGGMAPKTVVASKTMKVLSDRSAF